MTYDELKPGLQPGRTLLVRMRVAKVAADPVQPVELEHFSDPESAWPNIQDIVAIEPAPEPSIEFGSPVVVRASGQRGTVIAFDGDQVWVRFAGGRATVNLADLRLAITGPTPASSVRSGSDQGRSPC